MPRNGDGSGDSGPYEGHEILHGTNGDETLQHTKHVAPMPKHEDGEALPGMNASGGAAAPLNDASEDFGAMAPRNEHFGDDETSASNKDASASSNAAKGTSASGNAAKGSSNNKSSTSNNQQSSAKPSGGAQSSSGRTTRSSQKSQEQHNNLEDVQREKAERFINLDEEDAENASAGDGAKSSSQRAPRDVGSKDDVEQLHGKASAGTSDDKKRSASSGGEKQGAEKSRKQAGGNGDNGAEHGHEHEHEHDPMRHNAAKFLNIEE